MSATTAAQRCVERVPDRSTRWPRFCQCEKAGKVERGGQWYCTIHDPERVSAKSKADEDARQAERDEQAQIAADASALAKRIGAGRPYYETSYRTAKGSSGYRRALILTFEEIEKLVSR